MMIATESVVVKKLKIKFSGRKTEAGVGTQLCAKPASFLEDRNRGAVNNGTNKICESKLFSSKSEVLSNEHHLKFKLSTSGARKRSVSPDIEDARKRQKLDRAVTQQCLTILKKLMQHQCGWPFNQPVDPVALNIPDYFSIITEPMDLGTVKSKLENNNYLATEEFATDVRLTFSNAMRYNPSSNQVHMMASKLGKIFETGWKTLEAKWLRGTAKVLNGEQLNKPTNTMNSGAHSGPRTPPRHIALPKSREHPREKVNSVSDARIVKVNVSKIPEKSVSKPPEENKKGIKSDERGIHQSKCDMCGNLSCGCNITSELSYVSSSDLTSETSASGGHACTSDASRPTKSTSGSQTSKSDPNSDGAVSAIDDGHVCPSSKLEAPSMDDANREEWSTPLLEVQLSPKRALRAAMLKSRFADTILKAQQKALIDHGDKADPVRLQKEKERLERRQREEKARIEAQIKAAEAAERVRAEAEMRQQRERDREAARLALQQMERTVVIGENLEIFKELEMLSGCSLSPRLPESDDGSEMVSESNPLRQLGLFIKDDYLDCDDEEMVLNGEEGEILL